MFELFQESSFPRRRYVLVVSSVVRMSGTAPASLVYTDVIGDGLHWCRVKENAHVE